MLLKIFYVFPRFLVILTIWVRKMLLILGEPIDYVSRIINHTKVSCIRKWVNIKPGKFIQWEKTLVNLKNQRTLVRIVVRKLRLAHVETLNETSFSVLFDVYNIKNENNPVPII